MAAKVIFLAGASASGKTALAIELSERFACEIISVDAAMVYKGMDIGTAKPDKKILASIPHHLVDIREVQDIYNVGNFVSDASKIIRQINSQGKTALLVGGTMMYYHALENGLADLPPADSAVRDKILAMALDKGWNFVYEELKKYDPQAAQRIHPNDKQRVQRALEVYYITGKSLSSLMSNSVGLKAEIKKIYFDLDKALLRQRIAQRVVQMLDLGLVEEVKTFYDNPDISASLPAMRAINYAQVWQYLSGELNYKEMQEQAVYATCQFAKRQGTWLQKWQANALKLQQPIINDNTLKQIQDFIN